jgi:hypothetical protein
VTGLTSRLVRVGWGGGLQFLLQIVFATTRVESRGGDGKNGARVFGCQIIHYGYA